MALTPAEKMRRRREKLKKEEKYEEYKAVQRERERKRYQNQKEELNRLPARKKETKLKEKREKIRQRVAKHRKLKTEKKIASESPAYKTASSLGRATARARSALPKSPRKKKIVVRKLFESYGDPKEKLNSTDDKNIHKNGISSETISKVKAFYEREDISRQAPGIKDVVTVRNEDGSKIQMQIRHLSSSINETHQLFSFEFGKIIGKSKFAELRPNHVLLSNKMPHNVCLCKYHENYISAVNTLHKFIPNFPSYNHNFIQLTILCKEATEDCWLSKCETCMNNLRRKLDVALDNDAPPQIKWNVWKDEGKTLMKVIEEGTSYDLAKYIVDITPQFLKHSLIKKEQAESYKKQREAVSSLHFDPKIALIQVDFSENFTCIAQDEVQSFHWVQPQVSLFTVSLWHSGNQHPMVIASDNLDHSKKTIIPYIDRVFEEIPDCVEEVNIWSDGPTSQFKNRYIAASLQVLYQRYNKRIIWNYFATSHGKGPVDGIGGAIKRQVRSSVIRRESIVFSAKHFAHVAKVVSTVSVIEMTSRDINHRNVDMKLEELFKNAPPILGISEIHCLCLKDLVPETYVLTKHLSTYAPREKSLGVKRKSNKKYQVYNSSGSSCSEDDNLEIFSREPPKLEDIKHGTYVLVQFDGPRKTKYRYVAVCQSEVDTDGDVKIMCLKLMGEGTNQFKVDETDVSYIEFEHIMCILPTPSLIMKGNRVSYHFNTKTDVYEKA